jgi:hypothetical protein
VQIVQDELAMLRILKKGREDELRPRGAHLIFLQSPMGPFPKSFIQGHSEKDYKSERFVTVRVLLMIIESLASQMFPCALARRPASISFQKN